MSHRPQILSEIVVGDASFPAPLPAYTSHAGFTVAASTTAALDMKNKPPRSAANRKSDKRCGVIEPVAGSSTSGSGSAGILRPIP